MGDILFAHPRHDYQSYTDYKRLIDLAGYKTCFLDEIDPHSDRCYIFSTPFGEWRGGWKGAKATIIYWDMEHYIDVTYQDVPGLAAVWCSDARYAQRVGGRHVMMGSDARLCGYEAFSGAIGTTETVVGQSHWMTEKPQRTHEFDVTFLAYMSDRRLTMAGQLCEMGVSMTPHSAETSSERHKLLQSASAMVYVHQGDEYHAIAPQRFAFAAAYELPILSETLPDRTPFGFSHLMQSDYRHLAKWAQHWTRPEERLILDDVGRALHQFLCVEHPFKRCVESAV